jgi:hypothetical protein
LRKAGLGTTRIGPKMARSASWDRRAICTGRWAPSQAQNRLPPGFAVLPEWRAATDDDEHYVYAVAL